MGVRPHSAVNCVCTALRKAARTMARPQPRPAPSGGERGSRSPRGFAQPLERCSSAGPGTLPSVVVSPSAGARSDDLAELGMPLIVLLARRANLLPSSDQFLHIRAEIDKLRPDSANFGWCSAHFGQDRSKSGQSWSTLGPDRANFGRVWPNPARFCDLSAPDSSHEECPI